MASLASPGAAFVRSDDERFYIILTLNEEYLEDGC